MAATDDLVSVIVPAYNAEATIDDTLRSVRSQTHRALDILVVDDGSSDRTAAIVERHVRADPRVRLLAQANKGVAAARNLAIANARGALIAPVDADDLWSPDKIALQLAALNRNRGRIGLVYTWFAIIDRASRIIFLNASSEEEGNVAEHLCLRNIVGNGSSPLMLRSAVEQAGGYDAGLRAKDAEGCEDHKLYLAIAERRDFALVRDFCTGYRELPGNMSADLPRMLRSHDLVMHEVLERHPEWRAQIKRGRTRRLRFMMMRSIRNRDAGGALRMLMTMTTHAPLQAIGTLAGVAWQRSVRRFSQKRKSVSLRPGMPFPIGDPKDA